MGNGLNHFNVTKLGSIVATTPRQLSEAAAVIREQAIDESQYICNWQQILEALNAVGIDNSSGTWITIAPLECNDQLLLTA